MARTAPYFASDIDAYYDRLEERWHRDNADERESTVVHCADCGEAYAYEGEEDGPRCESCASFESGYYGDLASSSPALNVTADAGAGFVELEMATDYGRRRVVMRISVGDAQDLRDAIDEASEMAAKEVA